MNIHLYFQKLVNSELVNYDRKPSTEMDLQLKSHLDLNQKLQVKLRYTDPWNPEEPIPFDQVWDEASQEMLQVLIDTIQMLSLLLQATA